MGPDYTRPQTDVEDRFRMAEGPPDLPSLANLAWMDLLRDEQLQQLIRTALEHNWDLQRAVASIDEFRARASFGVFGAGLAAPLLNAQVLEFQPEAVEAQSKQALAQYQQAVLTAFREVEDALIAVRTARLQSDAQQQQVTALQSALKLAELRYQGAGQSSRCPRGATQSVRGGASLDEYPSAAPGLSRPPVQSPRRRLVT